MYLVDILITEIAEKITVNVQDTPDSIIVNAIAVNENITLNIAETVELVTINITESPQNVTILIDDSKMGLQGPPGVPGVPGVAGGSYIHVQSVALSVWNIPHNLGFYPNVSVMDSSNRKVLTDINYVDNNNLQVIVVNEFSGIAYLS